MTRYDRRDGQGPDLLGAVLMVFCAVCGLLALAAVAINLLRALGIQ